MVTECDNLNSTHVGESGMCRGEVSDPVASCRGGVTISAWAVGGTVSKGLFCKFMENYLVFL